MPYSDAEMREIAYDPVRLKGYFWKVAMNAQRMALQNRSLSRSTGVNSPVTNYKFAYDEGIDLLADAVHMERFSKAILENIDAFVESCLEK